MQDLPALSGTASPSVESHPTPPSSATGPAWLDAGWFWLLLCLAGALPLLYPAVPPLTDVPGHIGRYAIQTGVATSPALRQWYDFSWTLVPNLGADLLVQWLSPHVGLEPAVKLIVMAIAPLQMAGYLLVARAVHGHVPATALFALPLAWCYPLQFGFINFSLAVAVATWAFALWVWMGRGPIWRRSVVFIPIACLLWVAHLYGWAVLCLFAGCHELMRRHMTGDNWPAAAIRTTLTCLPLVTPQILKMILPLPSTGMGATLDFLAVTKKLGWLVMALRDRWIGWDLLSFFLLLGLILWGLRSRRFTCDPSLRFIAATLGILFVAIPTQVIGSYYSDMRLGPVMLAYALLMLRPSTMATPAFSRRLAIAGTTFMLLRMLGTTASLYLYDRDYTRELAALDHLPRGSALVTLVQTPCSADQGWMWARKLHLGGMALSRRQSFSNDQWYIQGGQLLTVHFQKAGLFERDPSQRTTAIQCDDDARPVREAIAGIPDAFAYLWVIAPTRLQAPRGWTLLWHNGTSGLYRRNALSAR